MIFARAICAMLVLILMASCSPSGGGGKSLWEEAIGSFNDGEFARSLKLASELRNYDENAGIFLISQIATLDAMKHGGSFPSLKLHYEGASNLEFSGLPDSWQAKFFAARIFAEIYSQGRDVALKDFANGCMLFKQPIVEGCIKYLSRGALASYIATKNNIDRVYLSNVSYISARLAIGDRSVADFGIAMSLVGVDDLRSGSIVRDLSGRSLLDKRQINLYCELVKSGSTSPGGTSVCRPLSQ